MRILLAQLAPRKGDVDSNLARLRKVVGAARADLYVFPELFLSGYSVGDAFPKLALAPGAPAWTALQRTAVDASAAVVVGGPVLVPERAGEVYNAVLFATPDGAVTYQAKRFLPTYGPFEEGSHFTPTAESRVRPLGPHRLGLEICYDAFFPEVSRELALGGADLLVVVSAAPVTSSRLFERVLPARAVENALALLYVNRVGVEDGLVFGGGSGAWDARGEPRPLEPAGVAGLAPEELVVLVDLDLTDVPRWRRFRPTLRDVSSRPPAAP